MRQVHFSLLDHLEKRKDAFRGVASNRKLLLVFQGVSPLRHLAEKWLCVSGSCHPAEYGRSRVEPGSSLVPDPMNCIVRKNFFLI